MLGSTESENWAAAVAYVLNWANAALRIAPHCLGT